MACKARYGLKIGYITKEQAEYVAQKAGQKRGVTLRVYFCKECNLWHMTSKAYVKKKKCGFCERRFESQDESKKYCNKTCAKRAANHRRKQRKKDHGSKRD